MYAPAGKQPARVATTGPWSEKIRVLLVDDRPENLLSLEAILASPDYELIKAHSGADALRYLLNNDCAIILLDVQMPDMDGYEAADLIKKDPKLKDIPIIFLTAVSTEQQYVERGYRAGAVDYISKPIVGEYLQAKVSVFAQLHRARLRVTEQAAQLRQYEKHDSERRLVEVELLALRREQTLQRRYRDLVEGIPRAVVWAAEPMSLTLTFVSAGLAVLTGASRAPPGDRMPGAEALRAGDQLGQLVHPEDRADFESRLADLRPDTGADVIEHRLLRKNGEVLWLSSTVRVEKRLERSGDPDAFEIRGFSIDISDAKGVERTLRQLGHISTAISGTLDPAEIASRLADACVPDFADGCVVNILAGDIKQTAFTAELAPRAAELLTHTEAGGVFDPLRAPNIVRLPDPVAPPSSSFPRASAANTSGPQPRASVQVDVGLAGLGVHSFLTVPLPPHDDDVALGTVSMWSAAPSRPMDQRAMVVAIEVARQASQALKNALLYARERDAVKHRDEFISVASHELRTPIAALRIGLQNAVGQWKQMPAAPPALGRSLAVADRQTDRLLALVEQLLDVSRIKDGALLIERAPVDLGLLVDDVVARFQPELERKQIELTRTTTSVTGAWDGSRLDQVIANLITNAIKYGRGKPIDVVVKSDGVQAFVVVADHGIGVGVTDTERIFERFERTSAAREFSGLGLGLYIARQIVEAHGGSIHVESEGQDGSGSRFILRLPLTGPAAVDVDPR